MALSQADRISFSLAIVTTDAKIAAYNQAQAAITNQINQLRALDLANTNLLTSTQAIITAYQPEYSWIDGLRSDVTETDIQNAAKKTLRNEFFPNDLNTVVPSLASKGNVWTQTVPYALNYAIGKNYSEAYGTSPTNEIVINTLIQSFNIGTDPSTIITTVSNYISLLNSEVSVIVTNDPNHTIQIQNDLAIDNINNEILPALNSFVMEGELIPLQEACADRLSFLNTTRIPQLNAILGTITQDINTGVILTSSGAYGKRYGLLSLRLNSLGGSLSQLTSLEFSYNAQDSLKASIRSNTMAYQTVIPTSSFKMDAAGTSVVNLNDTSFLTIGLLCYVISDTQEELIRAVKSINGSAVTLNDIVPAKYKIGDNVRLYVDKS